MLPKHHKTDYLLKAGLFNNLSSFAELEKHLLLYGFQSEWTARIS